MSDLNPLFELGNELQKHKSEIANTLRRLRMIASIGRHAHEMSDSEKLAAIMGVYDECEEAIILYSNTFGS